MMMNEHVVRFYFHQFGFWINKIPNKTEREKKKNRQNHQLIFEFHFIRCINFFLLFFVVIVTVFVVADNSIESNIFRRLWIPSIVLRNNRDIIRLRNLWNKLSHYFCFLVPSDFSERQKPTQQIYFGEYDVSRCTFISFLLIYFIYRRLLVSAQRMRMRLWSRNGKCA